MSTTSSPAPPKDFIRTIVQDDIDRDTHGGRVVTRFPPEPNGYLHIGHAKSICLNFGLAEEFGGVCNLRFDDTNPETEDVEYVESIQQDVRWLGFDWGENLFFASDYFEKLYQLAIGLIEDGKAYVDELSEEEIRDYRGTISQPGRPSPYRDRSVAENLEVFRRMRAGEMADGSAVLRAKIDLAASNMKMRDPLIYRIRHAPHYRTGNTWPIYPLYDFAHSLEDAIEDITHSICTLEFENNRAVYDWFVENCRIDTRPRQYEFARLNLSYTIMSKRKLLRLVEEKHVDGWDDPRMPTISGLRRRGVTAEAVRNFCERIGVAKSFNVIDLGHLEFSIRDDLNPKVRRVLCVLRPLKVVIENYPEDRVEELEAPFYPHDVPLEGSRKIPFTRELYIERDDFSEDPPPKYFRLAPGREVRLRYGYFIRCNEVIKNAEGEIVELRCTYDPETRGGQAPDGRKVKGTIHWVSASRSKAVEVRLYDRLFNAELPGSVDDADDGEERDFRDDLNPGSLEILAEARLEPAVADAAPGTRFQFERQGYFVADTKLSTAERPVYNRIVTLRDTWAKIAEKGGAQTAAPTLKQRAKKEKSQEPAKTPEKMAAERVAIFDAAQAARYDAYVEKHGLGEHEASLLAGDGDVAALFEAATAAHDNPQGIANLILNELLRELKDRAASGLAFGGAELAELVALQDDGTLSGSAAKEVLAEMLDKGGTPRAIVEAKGLVQMNDEGQVRPLVDGILAQHGAKVAEYRGGKTALFGFFVGQVMRVSSGRANPKLVQDLLRAALEG